MRRSLRDLRPTRRGAAVAAIAAGAFVLGATTGARSLNAIVVPALVALTAAAVQLARTETPTVERTIPEPGFPGERRTIVVSVDAEVPCRVTDGVGSGLAADGATATVGHGGRFEYSIELRERGEYCLGPATCRLTDSLGLFAAEVESGTAATALVYPDVYELEGDQLSSLVRRVRSDERSSFDRLREFSQGDTMRDIHWRASAKRGADEFVVAEYDSYADIDAVTIVGEAALGSADAMASTVASVVIFLHDAGVPVTVIVPEGQCVAHPGETTTVLRLLALTPDGYLAADRRQAADARVVGEDGRATISLWTGDVAFDGVAGERRGREVLA